VVITFDGPAGAGKGTVAKAFALRYGFGYVDAGLVFRLVGFLVHRRMVRTLYEAVESIQYNLAAYEWNPPTASVYVKKRNVTLELKELAVAEQTSILASSEAGMVLMSRIVQNIAGEFKNVICDGRNTGSTIFPNAEFKFYLDARESVRAQRRYCELLGTPQESSLEEILASMRLRDKRDRTRSYAALAVPRDAHVIQTDELTVAQCVDEIAKAVFSKAANL
jgi:cytidylate kinase